MTPRSRTARALRELLERLRPRPVDTGMLHALREFAVDCYKLGQLDLQMSTTLPPPSERADSSEVTGSYSLVEPERSDE